MLVKTNQETFIIGEKEGNVIDIEQNTNEFVKEIIINYRYLRELLKILILVCW